MKTAKRKGASSMGAIGQVTLQALNEGALESASLSEVLAIDFSLLLSNAFPQADAGAIHQMRDARQLGVTKRMQVAASLLSKQLGEKRAFKMLSNHASDTVRGWAAYVLESDRSLPLEEKLMRIRILADDSHFCVREWAWLALRPCISQDINHSIALLTPWGKDASENIRRFAIESTRPRGVWSKHIAALKIEPNLGKSLLDQVMDDPSRYVQNACANWLNDAAKSNPDWVINYCERWRNKSQSDALGYVIRRALRNVKLSKNSQDGALQGRPICY